MGVRKVDEDAEDELDNFGTTIGTKLPMLQIIRIPSSMWLLTLIHSKEYPFSSQSFPSDNIAGVLSRTFTVKNISNSLAYTIASSCVCTSPMEVMTAGLLDFVKVSISASPSSFADHVH